ncbi:alpha/beta hydrolase [Prauserella halophila]|uniref:Alpha/beta hydrolase n=1 Tax=Prauserella halophila TaxID=185641 RepID=A0ABN1W0R7_9PSEU|nr:alpha/beta hydrolase [Prauserella halophila]MCP2237410.1 acetyl esterase [Prauserella halophila]
MSEAGAEATSRVGPITGAVDRMRTVLEEGFPPVWEMTGEQARAAMDARVQPVANLDDVRSATDRWLPPDPGQEALRVRVYEPHGQPRPRAGVVFCHGGGFVFCSVESHDGFCRRMARDLDAVVVSVDYRPAPEHPAPAAAEDAYRATCWAADNTTALGIDPERLVVAGDSAGGNLAAAVALMARDRDGPRVAAQALLYPVIEPDFTTESYRRYSTGQVNTLAAMQWYWQQYVPGDLPEPGEYVVPSRAATLAGLPPAVVVSAARDPLYSEGEAYATALRGAGVPVRRRTYPELFHGFLTILPFAPAASARDLLWADLQAQLDRPTSNQETRR